MEKFKAVGDTTIIVIMIGLLKRDGIVKNTVITIFFPLYFFSRYLGHKRHIFYMKYLCNCHLFTLFMLLMSLFEFKGKKISWKMKI